MTSGTRMMRWINGQLRTWWPMLAALVGGAILAALAMVVTKVDDDRDELRVQRDLLAQQSERLEELVAASQRREEASDENFQRAIGEVRALMDELFAIHDQNVALKLNDTLHQIAALLDRPAGTPPNPVNAVTPSPPAPSPSVAAPSPAPRSAPPPAPATTTPDQKNCAKRPNGPRC